MQEAPKSVVFFLEYVPEPLGTWMRKSLAMGRGEPVFADAVEQIIEATAWMKRRGFQHFDVHPENILVQDGRLLFTDFGLAIYREFDLTVEERTSMVTHEDYDRDTALMHLFHCTLFDIGYTSGPQRLALLRAVAADPVTSAMDPVRVALGDSAEPIVHHAKASIYTTELFEALMQDASARRYRSSSM